MDGLFLGDAICAEVILIMHYIMIKVQDLEFLKCNKIGLIVNCAGDQIENVF